MTSPRALPAVVRGERAVRRGPRALGLGSLVLATLVLASPVVLARGSARDASLVQRPTSVSGASGDGRLSLASCERAVAMLLAQDLAKVATGRPDVTASAASDGADWLGALGGPGTPATAQVTEIHDELIGPATSDIINAYQHDVATLLAAYGTRIAGACARVSAP